MTFLYLYLLSLAFALGYLSREYERPIDLLLIFAIAILWPLVLLIRMFQK